MSSIDQQFIEFIVKSLVGKPDKVDVTRRIDEKGVLLELTVDPEDLGRVIGRRGATAQSLRTLLRALGTKNDARYNLKVIDNGGNVVADNGGTSDDSGSGADDSDDYADTEEKSGSAADDSEGDDEPKEKRADPDSLASKTRKELADLDDLDV